MSEKVSKALIRMLNEWNSVEIDISKVEAAIFIKNTENLIREKIAYLYNLLQIEAKTYNQKPDKDFEKVEKIISLYKEKLNLIYEELYLQYVNIQNEIGEARLNQKIAMINYQKIINDIENGNKKSKELKEKIKIKNKIYDDIITKCNNQFKICTESFEKELEKTFFIENDLQIMNESNVFQKIKNKISNIINGSKKYANSLLKYENLVKQINVEKITEELRSKTIDFVAEVLEMKKVDLGESCIN